MNILVWMQQRGGMTVIPFWKKAINGLITQPGLYLFLEILNPFQRDRKIQIGPYPNAWFFDGENRTLEQ